jgi:hypothetical protein
MVAAVLLILLWAAPSRGEDFPCPNPSQQTDSDIKGEVDGKAQTFLKLGGAELKGNVEKTVVDLFSKYPNADRVAIVNTLLSTTCLMIRNSKQLNDVEKFDKWMAVLPIIQTFLQGEKNSDYKAPVLNLETIELGMQKQFADSVLGKAKFVGNVEIRGEKDAKTGVFSWEKRKEYYYRYAGADVRIIFDDDGMAISIFVGLWGNENAVYLTNGGDWPLNTKNDQPIKWADLKFRDVGDENCNQWVNTAASAGVVSITCEYTHHTPGGSSYNKSECFFPVGTVTEHMTFD